MIKVYTTYHPAALMRDPSKLGAVEAHLKVLNDHVEGRVEMSVVASVPVPALPPPPYRIGELSLDIETYGIVSSLPTQRYFHPLKSLSYDGVSKEQLVQTCGLSWRDSSGAMCSTVFVMGKESHQKCLGRYLTKLKNENGTLLGQNLNFDLTYLRMAYPQYRRLLDQPLRIMDLSVLNYLHYESRPERSLKNLAPLFGVTKYETKTEDGAYKRYRSDTDPDLWRYNTQDTESTLILAEKLREEICSVYGKGTDKLSDYTARWYSDLLWLVVWMTESGVAVSQKGIEELKVRYDARQKRLMDYASKNWTFERVKRRKLKAGVVEERYQVAASLQGEGSDAFRKQVISEALDEVERLELKLNVELETTEKRKEISVSDANRNALLDVLPRTNVAAQKLRCISRYETVSKLIDSFVDPLLFGRKGKVREPLATKIIDDVVYPRWFPVPGAHDGGEEGGAKVRLAAKAPSVPTFPPALKDRIFSRYDNLMWADLSQIEIVIAALLSNDDVWMEELRQPKPDVHRDMAILMFGPDIVNHPNYKEVHRQAAKMYNFRMIYRGGAKKVQDALMAGWGIFLSFSRIKEIDDAFWAKHPRLHAWHGELVATAAYKGFLELPLIGQSRSFPGGAKGCQLMLNEIVNTPVQGVAACIELSAQMTIWQEFRRRGMKAIVPINIYDAIGVEYPNTEASTVELITDQVLANPPYYNDLCSLLGRRLPLRFEKKIFPKMLDKKPVWW